MEKMVEVVNEMEVDVVLRVTGMVVREVVGIVRVVGIVVTAVDVTMEGMVAVVVRRKMVVDVAVVTVDWVTVVRIVVRIGRGRSS